MMIESIAVSSWSWHQPYFQGEVSLLDIPHAAAALGIRWVELNDFMLPPPRFSRTKRVFHQMGGIPLFGASWRYDRRTTGRLQEQLDEAGVSCLSWTLDTDLTANEVAWPRQAAYIDQGMRTAGELGAKLVRLTLGGRADTPAEMDRLVVDRLRRLGERYAHMTPLIENHGGLSTDPVRLLRILDSCPAVGLCFDPGNLDPEQSVSGGALLIPRAAHIHIKTRRFDRTGNEAEIDYGPLFRQFKQAAYSGALVIEYEGDDEPERGVIDSLRLIDRFFDQ